MSKSKRTNEDIALTEAEYWDENKLERTRIKKLRRHSFYYSYKREARIFDEIIPSFKNQNVLEIGSHSWISWIKGRVVPKKLTCINISQVELNKGIDNAKGLPFDTEFLLMDANNLRFPDNSFDIVYGGAILHHLDIEQSVGHIHRVLKPGGKILFLEPLNMNPLYKLYRALNTKERTPDEHALVGKDFKLIRKNFTFDHYFFDFFTVITGFISLKIYGDKNFDNVINKFGYKLDRFFSQIPFLHFLFARAIIYGKKK